MFIINCSVQRQAPVSRASLFSDNSCSFCFNLVFVANFPSTTYCVEFFTKIWKCIDFNGDNTKWRIIMPTNCKCWVKLNISFPELLFPDDNDASEKQKQEIMAHWKLQKLKLRTMLMTSKCILNHPYHIFSECIIKYYQSCSFPQ